MGGDERRAFHREQQVNRDLVKIAAVQISGHDKGDPRRESSDAADEFVPNIERAGKDSAQLVVFPEYLLGRIQVPGPTTKKISTAAAAQGIYVIVGCWEVDDDATFATIDLKTVRKTREASRNFQQRRLDFYGELVKPVAGEPRPLAPQANKE